MLSKMGWSEGKGLGAQENGTTSHVKVSKRRENLGIHVLCTYNNCMVVQIACVKFFDGPSINDHVCFFRIG